jgi:hypothetical protein
VLRRFVRRLTVEGHERRHAAGRPGDLRAPPIARHRADFDDVGSTVNRVSKAERIHNKNDLADLASGALILVACFARASEGRREAAPGWCDRADLGDAARKILSRRQIMHRPSTVLAQLFHR